MPGGVLTGREMIPNQWYSMVPVFTGAVGGGGGGGGGGGVVGIWNLIYNNIYCHIVAKSLRKPVADYKRNLRNRVKEGPVTSLWQLSHMPKGAFEPRQW